MLLVLMGVSGSGKSTIGQFLADRQGWDFLEADDFHPEENVRKLESGKALTDEDREPWLDRLNAELHNRCDNGCSLVLACSALKDEYRDRLEAGLGKVQWVHLAGSPELIRERLAAREGHFASPRLLPSQLATLEPPQDAIVVSIDATPATIVERLARSLGLGLPKVDDAKTSRRLIVGNLLVDAEGPRQASERFDTLAAGGRFKFERILSHGHKTPDGQWYDQDRPEWVLLISGRARIEFTDNPNPLEVGPGDFLFIPAHCRHKVEWTDPDGPTLWLALHFEMYSSRSA